MNFKNNKVLFCLTLFICCCTFSCSSKKLTVKEIEIEKDGQVIAVVKAEIAVTHEERSKGLMYRKSLQDGHGMFFVFEKDEMHSFWMKNTYIPLSIAFIAYNGIITDIKDMYPLDTNSVKSSRSVRYALETPQGWFLRAGVKEGDTVKIDSIIEK
jgi:uncharacterized membrane protein (UPF0127 family)